MLMSMNFRGLAVVMVEDVSTIAKSVHPGTLYAFFLWRFFYENISGNFIVRWLERAVRLGTTQLHQGPESLGRT